MLQEVGGLVGVEEKNFGSEEVKKLRGQIIEGSSVGTVNSQER